jgi:hypothetical protein
MRKSHRTTWASSNSRAPCCGIVASTDWRFEIVTKAAAKAIDGLLGYLKENQDSLWYADRLTRGLPIGSGLIEGACKNVVAARLKANSARWRIRRVERIGTLRCLDYSGLWDRYWSARAA